jgi:hypothetical protein
MFSVSVDLPGTGTAAPLVRAPDPGSLPAERFARDPSNPMVILGP